MEGQRQPKRLVIQLLTLSKKTSKCPVIEKLKRENESPFRGQCYIMTFKSSSLSNVCALLKTDFLLIAGAVEINGCVGNYSITG